MNVKIWESFNQQNLAVGHYLRPFTDYCSELNVYIIIIFFL